MKKDIAMSTGLDLPEKGVDLAKLIFDIARECDTTYTFSCSIDASGFRDKILLHLDLLSIQYKNQHLSDEERQKLIDVAITENEQNKTKVAAEKEAKRKKVKQYINENAEKGYELAYSLCKNDNSNKAKKLKYRLINCVPGLSIEEKIEICRLYAESLINLGKSGNEIAKVYCQMANLVYPINKGMDYSLCLSFYEKAYKQIDKPTYMLNEIIAFCNRFGIDELRTKCQQKNDSLQPAKRDSEKS